MFWITLILWAAFFVAARLLTPKPPKEIQEAIKEARQAKKDSRWFESPKPDKKGKDPLDILRSY